MNEDTANRYLIPLHYTAQSHSCDVGIDKSLKDRLRKKAINWSRDRFFTSESRKMPFSKLKNVLLTLKYVKEDFQ